MTYDSNPAPGFPRVLRSFAKAGALGVGALMVASCSALLNWNGYTGGDSGGTDLGNGDGGGGQGDEGGGDAASADVAAEVGSAETGAPEGSAADGGAAEAGGDSSAPACGPVTCGGCCDSNGFCAGGQSSGTCGTGGERCQNCGSTGLTCQNNKCSSTPPPDAGTATCNVSACGPPAAPPRCIPIWQVACCKDSDMTCGCQQDKKFVPPQASNPCL